MVNRKIALVMGVCAAVLFSGCGGSPQTTSSTTPAETQEAASAGTDTATPTPEEDIDEVTGKIKSFTGGNLIIEDDQSQSLNFELGDAKLECTNGILAGDQVSVIYEGTIDGTDTGKVTVIKVIDKGEREELEEESLVGTITDASMNTLTVKNEEGDITTFVTTGAEISCKHGLELGNWVKITYKGEVKKGNAKNVKVISIVDDDDHITEKQQEVIISPVSRTLYTTATVNVRENYSADSTVVTQLPAGYELQETGETANGWAQVDYEGVKCYVYETYLSPVKPSAMDKPVDTSSMNQDEQQMNALIDSVDKNIIIVESGDDDETYKFDCTGAEIYLQKGLMSGSVVDVNYIGTASSDPSTSKVLSVIDAEDDEDEAITVTGTVLACSMNTLTIMSDDGAQITCSLEEADINMDGLPEEGAYVQIEIEPDSDSNVYEALAVSYPF